MVAKSNAETSSDLVILITRVFDAPRDLVWKAWTESDHMTRWYGPRGFNTRIEENDFRVGGHWRYVMIGPDGKEYPSVGVFKEIVPHERIVTTDEFGEDFENTRNLKLPSGIVVTSTFEDLEGKTKVTISIRHKSVEDRRKHEEMGVVGGWNTMLDCLDEYLGTIVT